MLESSLLQFLHTQRAAAQGMVEARGFAGAFVAVLEEIGAALDCAYAGIWTRSPCGSRFELLAGVTPAGRADLELRASDETTTFTHGQGLIGCAWERGSACYAREPEDGLSKLIANQSSEGSAAIAVPVPIDGEIEVVLAFADCGVDASSSSTLDLLSSVGQQLGRAMGRLRNESVPADPEVGKAALVQNDASQVERLEAQLRQVRENATAQARRHLDFLAVLGHEFRNPLAALVTASELLDPARPETVERVRGVLQRQTNHLTRLVDDLLDGARASRGKLRIDLQRLDLAEAIETAVEMTEALFRERGHRLHLDVRRGLWVDGDRARLAQVFQNLMANAGRYTPPGGNVWISAERQPEACVVLVTDDGFGMKPETLDVVFQPFVQGESSSEARGGLGLGLALVKSLVDLHGGSVEARSSGLGRGSEFIVRLPNKSIPSAS